MTPINSLEEAVETWEKIETKDIINKIINIGYNLNLHLEITEYFPNTYENNYTFINYLKFVGENDEIYDTSLFLSQKLLGEFTQKTYEILENFNVSKLESFFDEESEELNKIIDFIKSEYDFYKKLYKTEKNIKYILHEISVLIGLYEKFEDLLDIEILQDYPDHNLYHSSNIEINSDSKIVIDFYEIKDEYKGYFYSVNPIFVDKENNGYSMKEYFSILTLYLLGIFEYRKYSKGNNELVKTIENIIRGEDKGNLMGTGINIKEVYERININHSQD